MALCATDPTGQRFMKASLTRVSGRRGSSNSRSTGTGSSFMFIFWMKPHLPTNRRTAAGLRKEARLERIAHCVGAVEPLPHGKVAAGIELARFDLVARKMRH